MCQSRLFYQSQRVGFNPSKEIPWRGISGLKHGCDRNADLTGMTQTQDWDDSLMTHLGGWYDGGDNVVFVFPLAHTITMLAWSIIDFKQGFERAREYNNYVQGIGFGSHFTEKSRFSENGRFTEFN